MGQTSDVAILEALILNEEMSISELTRQVGVSYPTAFSKLRAYPFICRIKKGRETLVSIDETTLDMVFPFVTAVLTSPMKQVLLALAYARRKGFRKFLVGGELALQMQSYVRDADPNPSLEIRSPHSVRFQKKVVARVLRRTLTRELPSLNFVRDSHVRPELSTSVGVLPLSRPEKIAVDAIAESKSEVYVDSVVEAIRASPEKIDLQLLRQYAEERGVLQQTLERLGQTTGLFFP